MGSAHFITDHDVRLPRGAHFPTCSSRECLWRPSHGGAPGLFASIVSSNVHSQAQQLISLADFQFTADVGQRNSAPRRSRRRRAFFGSISEGIEAKLRGWRLKRTFDEIDSGHKGFVEEGDLQQYAEKHGLPTEYVPAFMESALKGGKVEHLRFDRFKVYVSGREESLARTFQRLDLDHDGHLTAAEVEAGLQAFAFTCPFSRCVYRTKEQAVRSLLNSLGPAAARGAGITFGEFRRFFLLLPRQDMLVDYWLRAACPSACDIGARILMRDDAAPAKGSPWNHLTAGAVAGMASRTAVAPLETLRLQAMVGQAQGPSLLANARSVVARSGWAGLYKGNAVNMMHSAPQKALSFFAFDLFKGLLHAGETKSVVPTFLAAGLAGATACASLYPLDVVRSRLMCDTVGRYRNTGDALATIVRTEGVPALFRGIGPSVAAIIPEAAITYGLFDLLKKGYTQVSGEDEAGVLPSIVFGVISSFTGQLVAYPLETVTRHMQVGGVRGSGRAGALAVMRDITSRGGPAALYKGVGAASLRVIPMAIVSFGTYEALRVWLTGMEERRRHERALRAAAAAAQPEPVYFD